MLAAVLYGRSPGVRLVSPDAAAAPWLHREALEADEHRRLAPFASFADASGGRRREEADDAMRTAFQRDRDRIIHSTAFRRLQHKTQVFAAHEGDHYRSRMTHSLEVSQMARSAALALRLNPDLAEAVALAHDLGHPPFGHVGEEILDELMAGEGGFRHNAQVTRIVDQLEDRYGHGHGLNLTFAMRRSLLKGRIPAGFPLTPDLLPRTPPPLEASLVDHCDRIAYLSHDLDDALRAGLVSTDDASGLALWQAAQERLGTAASPARICSQIVTMLMHDLVGASAATMPAVVPPGEPPGEPTGEPTDEPTPRIRHDDTVTVHSDELLAFLRERFYRSKRVLDAMQIGRDKIAARFRYFVAHQDAIPVEMRRRSGACSPERRACDYVAGMTDRFLMQQ